MGLTQLNFAGLNKVEVAIARLKEFEPPEGYYLAFSGGKDSVVIYDLAVKSGIKFDAHYSQGGIDPPELVQFIRQYYSTIQRDRPEMSVWEGVLKHGLPGRFSRWCCELIKEHCGSGRRVITGIRWQESYRRRQRQMVEVCQIDKTKIYVHPIIDWSDIEIWDYIHSNNLPYCKLYDEGLKRLGCVMCPMASSERTQLELKRWPKIANAWRRAAIRYYNKTDRIKVKEKWSSGEEMFDWWLKHYGEPKVNDAQCIMFDN